MIDAYTFGSLVMLVSTDDTNAVMTRVTICHATWGDRAPRVTHEHYAEGRRRAVKKWQRKQRSRCRSCGGTRTVDAVDNFGHHYVGCAVCVITMARDPKAKPGEGLT